MANCSCHKKTSEMFCNDKDYDNFVFKSGKAAATANTKVFRKNRELKNKAHLWTFAYNI